MEKQAISKYQRISAFKAREITRLIQGKSVDDANALLAVSPQKAARLVQKVLRSAVANAEDADNTISAGDLIVKEAVVGEGPTMKRFRPKARGMAGRIRKRTSHIKVVVSDNA
jgi:large subunit ribosomal protein L22